MDLLEILTGIGAVLTGGIGIALLVREARRRERRESDRQIDDLTRQVHTLRADLLEYHRWAYGLAERLVDVGEIVPDMPPPQPLAEAAAPEDGEPRRPWWRRKS